MHKSSFLSITFEIECKMFFEHFISEKKIDTFSNYTGFYCVCIFIELRQKAWKKVSK